MEYTKTNKDNNLNSIKEENKIYQDESLNVNVIDFKDNQSHTSSEIKESLKDNLNLNEQDNNINTESIVMNTSAQEVNLNEASNSNTTNTSMNKQANTKFYDNLRTVIKTQENILNMTGMASEKIKYANEISLDQLNTFQENSQKYGKYLKLIQEELQMIGDLMKKIKKDVKNQ